MAQRATVWGVGIALLLFAQHGTGQAPVEPSVSTSYGNDFYLGFMDTFVPSLTTLRLVIGTSASNATYVVTRDPNTDDTSLCNDEVVEMFCIKGTVSVDHPAVVDIPPDLLVSSPVDRNKGIRVYTENGEEIFVVGENQVSSINHGAFLAYPCLTLEAIDRYEYYAVSREATSTFLSQVLIVGCEHGTTISIIPTHQLTLPVDLQDATSQTVTVEAGTTKNFTLHRMQTLFLNSSGDLTGTKITSDKPLSVISGHECSSVPSGTSGCEPLAVFVPPSITWGTDFLLAAFAGRNTSSFYKFVSTEQTSLMLTCGNSTQQLNIDGNSLEYSLVADYCYLRSSNPVFVVQLAVSSSIDGRGDPAITLVSPIDQYVNSVSFVSLRISDFADSYITVTVPRESFNANNILLNGDIIDCQWNSILNGSEIVGYGCRKQLVGFDDIPRQHTVSHAQGNGLISVIVYGFSSSTAIANIGYAFLAGQRVSGGDNNLESLPILDITGFPGVQELERVEDSTSDPVHLPIPVRFGDDYVTTAYVNENGAISFDEPWMFSYPDRFPTDNFYIGNSKVVAPFWSDNDIRKEGTVRYVTYCEFSLLEDSDKCRLHSEGEHLLNMVNRFVQGTQDSSEDLFVGKWMLIAQWDHVHPSPHGDDNTRGISENLLSKTNTYQAIIVSDISRTYALYTYTCGDIQWSVTGPGRAAVVGYNAARGSFFNHALSGYSSIGDAVSCPAGGANRMKRQTPPSSTSTNRLSNPTSNDPATRCAQIVRNDPVTRNNLMELNKLLVPCPPTRDQVLSDTGRFRPQPGVPNCYVTMSKTEYDFGRNRRDSIARQCCYHFQNGNWGLITGDGSKNVGTLLLQHPIREANLYNAPGGDKDFRNSCCDDSLHGAFCTLFFQRRRSSPTEAYKPPATGHGYGDPHYLTFDQVYYNFQGLGRFTVLETTSGPKFTIQAKTETLDYVGVTWHVLLAFGEDNATFEVGMQPGFRVFRTRDNTGSISTEISLTPGVAWNDANQGYNFELKRDSTNNNKLRADFFGSGMSLVVEVYRHYSRNVLDYFVHAPRSSAPKGLFGNLDDNKAVEFFRRGDTQHIVYPVDPNRYTQTTDRYVYDGLQTWATSSQESIFSMPFRRKRQVNPDFMPIFFSDLNFTDAQRLICENNPECLLDFHATNDTEVAMTTLNSQKEVKAIIDLLGNFPPNISARSVIEVTIGQTSTLTLEVTDSNDNFTLSLLNGLPEDATLEATNENEYVFRWTPEQVTYEPLTFIANDTRGASTLFTPTVQICGCVNGGTCTLDGVSTIDATIVLSCVCTEAFDGRLCEEDRNGCSEIECFEGVECMDVPAPGVGAVCGSCPPGYTGDTFKCYDIDECLLDDSLCDHNCTNTAGGYTCSCLDGYQLVEATNLCEDINECSGVSDCQQLCQNTVGSYTCNCMNGFTLAADGRSCNADQTCNRPCSFGCAVVNGQEQCFCPIGFQLDVASGTQCVDQDECELHNPCDQNCTNTGGSFLCSCMPGYKLLTNGRSCEDIDECFEAALLSTNLCESDPNSQCVNGAGTFECVCVSGYTRNENGTCERLRNVAPPPVVVILPTISRVNSVNFTAPTFNLETFSPEHQQRFRQVTATAVNSYCSNTACTLILSTGGTQMTNGLTIEPANVALPISLVGENTEGQLMFTLYVQIGDMFLSLEQLETAIMQAEELYRDAGFLALTTDSTTDSPTTRSGLDVGAIAVGIVVAIVGVAIIVTLIVVALAIVWYFKYHHQHVIEEKPQDKKVEVTIEMVDGLDSKDPAVSQ